MESEQVLAENQESSAKLMGQPTPEKHFLDVLIILTLFALVGPVSVNAFTPLLPLASKTKAGIVLSGLLASMLTAKLITRRTDNKNYCFADCLPILTDLRYMRFAIATGAAFSGAFAFIAGASHVFMGQLSLSFANYSGLFAIAVSCYLLSATIGTRLTSKMCRSQSNMLAASLMLMGAVTCMGSSFLTNGKCIYSYLVGIGIYKLGMGFFMPLCQARAVEHITENICAATNFIFFIEILMATLTAVLVHSLPEAGTLPLSAITLVMIIITNLCLLGVDRERDGVHA